MDRIVISGSASGAGKTSIATGLMAALSRRETVQAYKIGPDFIDPMYHKAVTGRPSRNLDGFMMGADTIKGQFHSTSSDADLCVIEGVRGLYEGIHALEDTASTAQIAKLLDAPVVLVMDARSLTRSAAAMVMGFKIFDPDVRIAGVILNNVSGDVHKRKLRTAVEELAGTEVLGFVSRRREAPMSVRHLGLKTVHDDTDKDWVRTLEEMLEEVDIDRLRELASTAAPLEHHECHEETVRAAEGLVAAVPRDEAFSFYYPENLEGLEARGFKVVSYSPVGGEDLPDADLHFLGGGYPELKAEDISDNLGFIHGLRSAHEEGIPIYGECGGLMALCETITDMEGNKHKMAGILPADCAMEPVRQGLSYVEAEPTGSKGKTVRGHEFHYSSTVLRKEVDYAYRMMRGRGIDGNHDGIMVGSAEGRYMHRHALADDDPIGSMTLHAVKASEQRR